MLAIKTKTTLQYGRERDTFFPSFFPVCFFFTKFQMHIAEAGVCGG